MQTLHEPGREAHTYPVIVREYRRIRDGRIERVRRHGRRQRRWFRRPTD